MAVLWLDLTNAYGIILHSPYLPIKSVRKPIWETILVSDVQQAPIRALMADLTLTTRSVLKSKWIMYKS